MGVEKTKESLKRDKSGLRVIMVLHAENEVTVQMSTDNLTLGARKHSSVEIGCLLHSTAR